MQMRSSYWPVLQQIARAANDFLPTSRTVQVFERIEANSRSVYVSHGEQIAAANEVALAYDREGPIVALHAKFVQ